jgi:hypothetical protein
MQVLVGLTGPWVGTIISGRGIGLRHLKRLPTKPPTHTLSLEFAM